MTVIITGANRSLGYESALALAADLYQTSVELSHLQPHLLRN
jgi:NAD(P)-dependent dehydrogenase (short-subunit alcohol dehydrogenase family)